MMRNATSTSHAQLTIDPDSQQRSKTGSGHLTQHVPAAAGRGDCVFCLDTNVASAKCGRKICSDAQPL